MKKIIAAFAGVVAGVGLLLAPSAEAAPRPDDCRLVGKADRSLCQTVKRQVAYAYVTKGGNLVSVPNGRALVKYEVTHAGLSKREMHEYLKGYAFDYAKHVTRARSVAVDLGSLRKAYGSDAEFAVGFEDADGKPGGAKNDRVDLNLP